MSSSLSLASGALRCDLAPALGGCVAGLWLGDVPVLRPPPAQLMSARQSGCYPLVPFSNRIAHATLLWQGTSHPLVRHPAEPEPHAIHGVGWQRPWEVLEAEAGIAMLAYEHRPDSAWPFAFDVSQTFRLTGDALEMGMGITNQSNQPQPVGLGWHPWFVKRSRSRIAFEASGRWDMGDDKLPTQRKASRGLDADCARLDVDNCFDGWPGTLQLRDEVLHVRLESNLRRLVVFTNDTRDCVAIEPVSHVNNAIALAGGSSEKMKELGIEVLAPGASLSAQLTITVSPIQ